MKKLFATFYFLFFTANIFAQNYKATDVGSAVKFVIKNFGLNVGGSFKGLLGKIIFDPANPRATFFNVSIDATTVSTGNDSRDKHLRKEDYLDIANHPRLSFTSTKITDKAGVYIAEGDLTIKGISKKISFPFTATAGTNGYHFEGQFRINRRDFKVGDKSWVLSDELTVSLNVSAIKQ